MSFRPPPDSPESFWPRRPVGPRVIDENVFCEKCGYNLRGLNAGTRCPECGHRMRLRHHSILPWQRRRGIGVIDAYAQTAWMVLRYPQRFAEESLVEDTLDRRAGRVFRHITVVLAFLPLMALFLIAARSLLTDERRTILLPLGAAVMLLLWLDGITGAIVDLFVGQQATAHDRLGRLIALSQYTCAPLLLSALHPLMCLLVLMLQQSWNPLPLAFAIALWIFLTAAQWAMWMSACLQLARVGMNLGSSDLGYMALVILGIWGRYSLTYLLVVPGVLYWFGQHVFRIV